MFQNSVVIRSALLTVALLSHATSHAQIYKWVDASGKTHYSDNKAAAGKAEVGAIRGARVADSPTPAAGPTWQEREREYKARQARNEAEERVGAPRPKRQSKLYAGHQVDNDQSKCALARDVIGGAVRHGNGAVTDTNDRQIAERDIQTFCR